MEVEGTWVISTRGSSLQAAAARLNRFDDTLKPTRRYLNMRMLLHEYSLCVLLALGIQVGDEVITAPQCTQNHAYC